MSEVDPLLPLDQSLLHIWTTRHTNICSEPTHTPPASPPSRLHLFTFALQVRPSGFEDRQEDGEQLHQVSGDVTRRGLVVHHVQRVEGLQRTDTQSSASFTSAVHFCSPKILQDAQRQVSHYSHVVISRTSPCFNAFSSDVTTRS